MARPVGEETVILDVASGTYFGLDPVGARVWQLMEEGRKLAEICEAMLEEFEVSREELEHDVLALAQDLEARSLISTE
ncbi:MAG: PqqD family protein [Hyphomicrobiaceae bacterium]